MTELPTYSDTEAFELGLHPANAFRAFAIAPGTIRSWASTGRIQPRGIGARGANLYSVAEVSAYSISVAHRPRGRRVSTVA